MTTRLALLFVGGCSIWAAGASSAQDATFPAESSLITKLADEAIVAGGPEAVRSREDFRSVFANAFLHGYSTPESTIPVNATPWSRMNGAGWSAGQAYRRAHPESVAQIMKEYGYKEFEGWGAWTVGFEAGAFRPEASGAKSPQRCWYLALMHSADVDAQIGRIVPRDAWLRGGTFRVRVNGYVSEPGQFGHGGLCERQVYAISVFADGG